MSEVTTSEVSRKTLTMASFEWKIRNFSGLPMEVDYCEKSPTFSFLDAKWQLEIYPNGENDSNGEITLCLMLVNSITKSYYVGYRVGIKKEDGTEYKSMSKADYFTGEGKGFGMSNFGFRPSLLKELAMNNETEPQDSVTIFCILHSNICKSKEVASQTMHPEGIEKLLRNLQELFSGEDGDVVLRVKDEEFKAHKALLRVRSPVFKSMFSHGMKEESTGVVDVTDCDPTVFREFLYYLYCGKVEEFSTAKVFSLYFVADKYDIDELKTKCVEFIIDNMSVDTFFDSIILALRHSESVVLKHATDFFIENSLTIVKTSQWLSFMKENLVEANELFIKTIEAKSRSDITK